jgi:tRNA-dihydrouridine synthase A
LSFDPAEHPVALQLGGSDPAKLAAAAEIGASFGYDEINLNVGCPSDRVQSGTFGACLMLTPNVVAECVAAMKAAVHIPVTVKCRIGVDDQDEEAALDLLADAVHAAGADGLWVHARKAWLQGLSPKENREIPPLNYDRVYRLKQRFMNWFVGINGGIAGPEAGLSHMDHVDGVMLGRSAYHEPACLGQVDHLYYGQPERTPDFANLLETMCNYAQRHIAAGGRLSHVTRHMVGLFHGLPGARRFRQILSEDANKPGAGADVLRRAFSAVLDLEVSAA